MHHYWLVYASSPYRLLSPRDALLGSWLVRGSAHHCI
jgi:hypothetical protein